MSWSSRGRRRLALSRRKRKHDRRRRRLFRSPLGQDSEMELVKLGILPARASSAWEVSATCSSRPSILIPHGTCIYNAIGPQGRAESHPKRIYYSASHVYLQKWLISLPRKRMRHCNTFTAIYVLGTDILLPVARRYRHVRKVCSSSEF